MAGKRGPSTSKLGAGAPGYGMPFPCARCYAALLGAIAALAAAAAAVAVTLLSRPFCLAPFTTVILTLLELLLLHIMVGLLASVAGCGVAFTL